MTKSDRLPELPEGIVFCAERSDDHKADIAGISAFALRFFLQFRGGFFFPDPAASSQNEG